MRPWDEITAEYEAKESSVWNDYAAFRTWWDRVMGESEGPLMDEIDVLSVRTNERGFEIAAEIGLYSAMCKVFDDIPQAKVTA